MSNINVDVVVPLYNKKDTIEEIFFKTCKIGIELLASIIKKITNKNYKKISVNLGKNYRSKDMKEDVKLFIDVNISKIINKTRKIIFQQQKSY